MPIRGEIEDLDEDQDEQPEESLSYVLHPNCAIEEM